MVWFSLVSVFVFNVQTNSGNFVFSFSPGYDPPFGVHCRAKVFLSRCVRSHSDVYVFSLMFLLFMDVCLFSFLVLSCFALAYA
jgi:hypothetical protein